MSTVVIACEKLVLYLRAAFAYFLFLVFGVDGLREVAAVVEEPLCFVALAHLARGTPPACVASFRHSTYQG